MRDKPYHQVAFRVLREFTREVIEDDALARMCEQVYDWEVPLEPAGDRTFVMRLDRGPTASFKDFAAGMMGRLIGLLVEAAGRPLTILTATSGDTGSAIAHAFHGVPGIRIVVLFPIREVSDRQRKQMTTLGGNVTTIAVDGKFDDCQAIVKRAFSDPGLSGLNLSSANSINVGRLLPQACYYFYACARLTGAGEPVVFSVPSGNFGDLLGGILAREMGVPVRKFVVATNANDEVPRFLSSGRYEKIVPSVECISNAMNVGHPSNLARLVDLYGGRMDETGFLHQPPDLERMGRDLFAISIDDRRTRETIAAVHRDIGLLLEPHGAVGWAGLEELRSREPDTGKALSVVVSTAHPAKFPEQIKEILGIDPALPPSLRGLEDRKETFAEMKPVYEDFRDFLGKLK